MDDQLFASKRMQITQSVVKLDDETFAIKAISRVSIREPNRAGWYSLAVLFLIAAVALYFFGEIVWALFSLAFAPVLLAAGFGANSCLLLDVAGRPVSTLKTRDARLLHPYKSAIEKAMAI
jgi:hypothetical protein